MARNKEFIRDRSSLGWSILFPFLVIAGFSLMFSENERNMYKVGLVNDGSAPKAETAQSLAHFETARFVEILPMDALDKAIFKLQHHSLDMVVRPSTGEYWISETSPNSYMVERILLSNGTASPEGMVRNVVTGREIPYVEWLFPGILGMNLMFGSLFGVGYVVVRYRKNGMLKRLSATPMKAYEYLISQVLSRVVTMMSTTAIVYMGCVLLYGFTCKGSFLVLLLVLFLGAFSMIALGLLVAARISSEELAGGLLNLMSWPMMFLSGVWFSLEGAKPWVRTLSQIFPLTHLIDAARQIMNDGAGIVEIRMHLLILAGMSLLFLGLGSVLFEWKKT